MWLLMALAWAFTAATFVGLQEYAFATFLGLGAIIFAIYGQKMAK